MVLSVETNVVAGRSVVDPAFFYPRDAMLARVLAMALYLSVCLSVCLCLTVCQKSAFYQKGWTDQSGFWHGGFLRSVLRCGNSGMYKNSGTSLCSVFLISRLRKFLHGLSF